MWHFNHTGPKESKFAKQLLFSLQAAGRMYFLTSILSWHFDDKVGKNICWKQLMLLWHLHLSFTAEQEARLGGSNQLPESIQARHWSRLG